MSKETENSEKIAQFGRALDFFKQRYLSDSSDVPTLRDAALKQFQLLQEQFDTFELNNLFLSDGEIWTADKVSQSTQNNFRQLQAEFEEKYIQAAPIETQGSPQETVAQKEPSQNKSEVALLAERLGFKGETVTGLEKIIPKILFIFNIIQTRKNTEYDPRTIKITKEDGTEQIVDVYAEALKYESIILGLAQILQNKTDLEDPFAYAASVEEFEQSFINPIQKLITKMDERIQEIDVQVEAEELAVIQTENAVDNSENEVQPLDLKTLYVLPQKEVFLLHTESDTKKKQKEAAEKNNNTQVDKIKELIAGKPFKEQKKILKATIAPLKKDIDGDIKILDSVAEDVKAIIIKKGLTDKINIEEENVFSQENIGLIRIHLKDNAPLLARLLKVEALIKKISRKAALLSNLSIVLESIVTEFERKNQSTETDENAEILVQAIYKQLKKDFSHPEKDYRLPEFEDLFELPPTEAYNLLAGTIVQRIEAFYVDALAGGSSIFAFQKGNIDLWSDDDLFNIPMEGADDNTTFKYFIANFPWERFLTDEQKDDPSAVIAFRKKIIDLWKYRILHIQNSSNAASGIENLWRGNEHGTYHEEVFKHIASIGDGGGLQGWDMGPYHDRIHNGSDEGSVLFRETFGEEETGWLMPEYENFVLYRLEQEFYQKLQLNDTNAVDKLTEYVSPDGVIYEELKKLIIDKYGEARFLQDKPAIDLAVKKAVWNLVYTLKIHEWDIGGIHSKLGRYNSKKYFGKVFATGTSGVRWRPNLAVSVEKAFMPLETFKRIPLTLTDNEGKPIYDEVTLDYKKADRDPEYARWLVDLRLKAVDGISYFQGISAEDGISNLKVMQAEASRIMAKPGEIIAVKKEIKSLEAKIKKSNSYSGTEAQQDAAFDKDRARLQELQKKVDAKVEYDNITELLAYITTALRDKPYGNIPDSKTAQRAATDWAVNKRYKIVQIKEEHTGLGVKALPIAIPRQRIERTYLTEKDEATGKEKVNRRGEVIYVLDDAGNKVLVEETAHGIPIQDIRNSQINTALYANWDKMPTKTNAIYVGYSGEAGRWFKMLDLTDHDAIFKPIHNPDIQDKIISRKIIGEEVHALKKYFNRGKIALLNLQKAGGEIVDAESVALAIDKEMSELVTIGKIPLHELVSGDEEKGQKPPGLAFPDIVQYAAKYLFGKTPDKLILLEMFREKVSDLDLIVRQESRKDPSSGKKEFWKRTTTPVPPFLRAAMDAYLDGDTGRAENEVIVGLFWLSIDAYLDQYAYDKTVSKDLTIPMTEKNRKNVMPLVETVSGVKPMNFADRKLFIAYVNSMLGWFESSSFASGGNTPRNLMNIADVKAMMLRKGIVGSEQQILVDLEYYDNEYKQVAKKSE